MMIEKNLVLPLVLNKGGSTPTAFRGVIAQRNADWRVVEALAQALQWALAQGGWRLPYYADGRPLILKQLSVTAPAEIDWDALAKMGAGEKL